MLDIITLKGLAVSGIHGVYDFEKITEQPFVVDVSMWVDTSSACRDDDIDQTVSYADIADDVKRIVEGPSVRLIETLAENIAQCVLGYVRVYGVEVTVHKPQAPIGQGFDDVYVQVRRGRFELDSADLVREVKYADAYSKLASDNVPLDEETHLGFSVSDSSLVVSSVEEGAEKTVKLPFVLAFGGNQGNVPVTLVGAMERLIDHPLVDIEEISPLLRTRAVLQPGMAPQADHWNAVVVGLTSLTPHELLALTSSIEEDFGRERPFEWAPRTLDIDLIAMGNTVVDDVDLVLPHPRAHSRAFVLIPWYLLQPEAELVGWGAIADLIPGTTDREGIVDAIEEWWENPETLMMDSDTVLETDIRSLPGEETTACSAVRSVGEDTHVDMLELDEGSASEDPEPVGAASPGAVLPDVPSFTQALVGETSSQVKPQVRWIPVHHAQGQDEHERSEVSVADSSSEGVDSATQESVSERPLPEWNFNSATVTVIDSVDDESTDLVRSVLPMEQAGRRAILDPDLPEGTPVGTAPVTFTVEGSEKRARRHTMRPTHTGMIPVVKRRSSRS